MYIKIKNGEKEEGGRHLLCDHRCEEFSLKNNFHLLECVRVPGPRSGVEKTPHQNGGVCVCVWGSKGEETHHRGRLQNKWE